MARTFAHILFERYADDIICHCKSAEEARALWGAIADRFAVCKLVLHPQKTKIVYCKDIALRLAHSNRHAHRLTQPPNSALSLAG
jgi:RNA-directed DNA polymerase